MDYSTFHTAFLLELADVFQVPLASMPHILSISLEQFEAWQKGETIDIEYIFTALDRKTLPRTSIYELFVDKKLSLHIPVERGQTLDTIQEIVVEIRASQNVQFQMLARILASVEHTPHEKIVQEYQSLYSERLESLESAISTELLWQAIHQKTDKNNNY